MTIDEAKGIELDEISFKMDENFGDKN